MLGTLCPTDRCRCLCGEALGFDSLVGGDLSDRERSRADENYTFVTDRSVVERQWRSSKVVGVSDDNGDHRRWLDRRWLDQQLMDRRWLHRRWAVVGAHAHAAHSALTHYP